MATSEKLGELYIDITGKDRGASAALDKVKGKATEANGAFKQFGDTASKVQGAVSKILMPAALIGSILGAVAAMKRFYDILVESRKEIDKINEAAKSTVQARAVAASNHNEQLKEQLALQRENEAAVAAVVEQIEKANGIVPVTLRTLSRFPGVFRPFVDSVDETNKGFEEQLQTLYKIGEQIEENLNRQQRNVQIQSDEDARDAKLEAIRARNAELENGRLNENERRLKKLQGELATLTEDMKTFGLEMSLPALDLIDNIKTEIQAIIDSMSAAARKAYDDALANENKLHQTRLQNVEELGRKMREAMTGAFGEGAFSTGGFEAIARAIDVLADRTGG